MDLPAAARADQGQVLAGVDGERDVGEGGFGAVGVVDGDAVEAQPRGAGLGDGGRGRGLDQEPGGRCGGKVRVARATRVARAARAVRVVQEREDPLGHRDALGTVVEGRARRAQRQIGLRREEEHDQGGAQVERAVQQPQADRDGDQRHRQGGDRLQDEGGEEGDPQGAHGGPPVRVGHLPHHSGLVPLAAERAQGGQTGDDVQEVAAQPGQQPPLPGGALGGVQADERAEHRDQRQGDHHDQRGGPVGEAEPDHHHQRDDGGGGHGGQVAREVGVQGVEAAGEQGGGLAV